MHLTLPCQTDLAARADFKWAAGHGVVGTPMFLLDGSLMQDASAAWTVRRWTIAISEARRRAKLESDEVSSKFSDPSTTAALASVTKNDGGGNTGALPSMIALAFVFVVVAGVGFVKFRALHRASAGYIPVREETNGAGTRNTAKNQGCGARPVSTWWNSRGAEV